MVDLAAIALLEPWHPVPPERRATLEAEAARELAPDHVLHGRAMAALARRLDRDDVLFEVPGLGYAVVHLTYSPRRETSPLFPHTTMYSSLDDWLDQGMRRDHEEF